MRETREGLGRGRAGDRARDGAGSLMGEPRLYSIPPTSLLRGGSRHSQLCEETWTDGWGGGERVLWRVWGHFCLFSWWPRRALASEYPFLHVNHSLFCVLLLLILLLLLLVFLISLLLFK